LIPVRAVAEGVVPLLALPADELPFHQRRYFREGVHVIRRDFTSGISHDGEPGVARPERELPFDCLERFDRRRTSHWRTTASRFVFFGIHIFILEAVPQF